MSERVMISWLADRLWVVDVSTGPVKGVTARYYVHGDRAEVDAAVPRISAILRRTAAEIEEIVG